MIRLSFGRGYYAPFLFYTDGQSIEGNCMLIVKEIVHEKAIPKFINKGLD